MGNIKKSQICVAPMMDWTDRHCRYFHRLMTKHTDLYTEMVTADAVIHGDRQRLLAFHKIEKPVILQLGGSDPVKLAEAAMLGEECGYTEINLNIGCPSPRVKKGRFGASLMQEPELVKQCMAAMKKAVRIPVTVKCRIGVDDMDDEAGLANFIRIVKAADINTFIIHARKAWLNGISPKQNREIPPLNYERVYRLKEAEPELNIIINGGIVTVDEMKKHLNYVDGVMIGRAAYHNPYLLADFDQQFFGGAQPIKSRLQVAEEMIPYIEYEISYGTRLHQITRHMLGLFHGQRGARLFRQILSQPRDKSTDPIAIYKDALSAVTYPKDAVA